MKVGAMDVGTNTVLMLVADAGSQEIHPLAEMSRITRLGHRVDKTGRLDPEAAARTLGAISDFAAEARRLGAEKIVCAATSALRDAADGPEFIEKARSIAAVELEIVAGDEEARLSHLAVSKGLRLAASQSLLIVDIGGGSTEFIRAEPGGELAMVSLQIGSVRLTERILHSDPPTADEASRLRAAISEAITGMGWTFRPDVMVGIAGTVTTIGALALNLQSYQAQSVHGYSLSRDQVREAVHKLGSLTVAERRRLPGIVEGRADVIFAGAVILDCAMEHFGADSVIVSDQGVRWGLVWRELCGDGAINGGITSSGGC